MGSNVIISGKGGFVGYFTIYYIVMFIMKDPDALLSTKATKWKILLVNYFVLI